MQGFRSRLVRLFGARIAVEVGPFQVGAPSLISRPVPPASHNSLASRGGGGGGEQQLSFPSASRSIQCQWCAGTHYGRPGESYMI